MSSVRDSGYLVLYPIVLVAISMEFIFLVSIGTYDVRCRHSNSIPVIIRLWRVGKFWSRSQRVDALASARVGFFCIE